jgi:hypothetical protein
MWKPEHRQAAERRSQRYPSDLTDAEWALVEAMIPPAKRGGSPLPLRPHEIASSVSAPAPQSIDPGQNERRLD